MGDQVFCKEKKNAKVKAEFVTHNPLLKWHRYLQYEWFPRSQQHYDMNSDY